MDDFSLLVKTNREGRASASTITQWCDWIEKAYLFFVPIFSDSEKYPISLATPSVISDPLKPL